MSENITGVIIARNEQADLPACLSSWEPLCARIIMVDDASTDLTPQIAADFGCDVIPAAMTPEEGYSGLRNLGLGKVDTAMTLVFDADERPTPELTESILHRGRDDGRAYSFTRRTNAFGGWLDYGRFRGDAQTRLFSSDVRYSGLVHETPSLPEGTEVVTLDGHVEHFTYASIGEYMRKMRCYAGFQAQSGEPPTLRYLAMQPAHNLFRLQGYKDGWRGLVMAIGDGWYHSMIARNARALDL